FIASPPCFQIPAIRRCQTRLPASHLTHFGRVKENQPYRRYCIQGEGGGLKIKVKTSQQSIWPVSVFGLGFLLLIMGLSGVASIQETRRIHLQILAVEDNYRHIENVVESIRSDTSRVAVLRRDRLLERDVSASADGVQLAD